MSQDLPSTKSVSPASARSRHSPAVPAAMRSRTASVRQAATARRFRAFADSGLVAHEETGVSSKVKFAGLKLDVLDLHDNRLEDTGGLEGQKALRVLNLRGNGIKDAGKRALRAAARCLIRYSTSARAACRASRPSASAISSMSRSQSRSLATSWGSELNSQYR